MSDHVSPIDVVVNRILIVEENQEQAEVLQAQLRDLRSAIDWARNAGQAHSAFHRHRPDLVILEAILPLNISGFEVCERIKQKAPSIPVLMLTVIDREDARDLARRVGVDAYLTKPCDPQTLLQQIRNIAGPARNKSVSTTIVSSGDLVRFTCPACGKHLKAARTQTGKTFHCPQCGRPISVP